MLRKEMRPYDQSLYDNIVEGKFELVAFRLMPQIESMLGYTKSPHCRANMDAEMRNLANVIKAANQEWRKQMDARWEDTR
jgi:hypothetical protein